MNDFRHEGEAISKRLILELKQIRTKDDLVEHASKLQELFTKLVHVIIQAEEFLDLHPEATFELLPFKEMPASEQLRFELNRVIHMEGGREVIAKAQEEAVNRLEAFEMKRQKVAGKALSK